ncbi:MAG: preprotein translocase subunit SecG [Kofleriaceae bacterium]
MSTLLTILHVVVCLFLMLTVLLQSGKGGGMGALGGGAGTATVFGGSGASTFLRRLTAGAGTVFMLTSMTLAFLASHNSGDALEKFGAQQQDLATQKEKEKERALEGAPNGSAGSGSGAVNIMPSTSSMSVDTGSAEEPVGSGDTTPIMGSGFAPGPATNPTPSADHPNSGSAGTPTTGSAGSPTPTPAAAPKAPAGQGTQSVEHPERPAAAPKADAPKAPAAPKADAPKADAPKAPAAPAAAPTPAPAPAPTPAQ